MQIESPSCHASLAKALLRRAIFFMELATMVLGEL